MIGERLKKLRKEKGLSQKELASLLETSQGYISDIEKGIKKPGSDFLISLKRLLKVDLNWFLADEGMVPEAGSVGHEWPQTTKGQTQDGFVKGVHERFVLIQEPEIHIHPKTLRTINEILTQMTEEQKKDVLKYVEERKLLSELMSERNGKKAK